MHRAGGVCATTGQGPSNAFGGHSSAPSPSSPCRREAYGKSIPRAPQVHGSLRMLGDTNRGLRAVIMHGDMVAPIHT